MPPAMLDVPPSGIQLPTWAWKYVSGVSLSEASSEGSSETCAVPRPFWAFPVGRNVRNWKVTWSISQSKSKALEPRFRSAKPAWVGLRSGLIWRYGISTKKLARSAAASW